MISGLMLASHGFFGGFSGGGIGTLLSYWEQAGFFSYVLPFLLIFAMIFGILTQIKLFKDNKAINGIIALTVGLLALQFDFVPLFFSEVFPRLGIGLAVLLVILILTGMFIDPTEKWLMYTLLGIGFVIVLVVLTKTFGYLGYGYGEFGYFIYNYWPTILGVIVILVALGIIVGGAGPRKVKQVPGYHPFWPGAPQQPST